MFKIPPTITYKVTTNIEYIFNSLVQVWTMKININIVHSHILQENNETKEQLPALSGPVRRKP